MTRRHWLNHGTPASQGRRRALHMVFVFALAVAARVLYFLVLSPISPEWSPEVLPRNGYLAIATNLVAGHGYSIGSLLTYFPAGGLVPTAARSPVPVFML